MRYHTLLILLWVINIKVNAQQADINNAFAALTLYAYGIPITEKFEVWNKFIKNNDDYTYITKAYKKEGIIFSNLISLKNKPTYDNTVDSVLFILQRLLPNNEATIAKDTINTLQIYIVFKKSAFKKTIDPIFTKLEQDVSPFFDEANINKNKYNNGTKIMYSLHPTDNVYPITIEKYFDEEINRFVISIIIVKAKDYVKVNE